MKSVFLVLHILLVANDFAVSLNKQKPPYLRRIGGTHNEAKEYPPYVVEVRKRQKNSSRFFHTCMGTLLTQTWSIGAAHCFPSETPLSDVKIFHGSRYWNETIYYNIINIRKHNKDDLAVINHSRINIASHFFPKLSQKYCTQGEGRGVYHSFGPNSDNETPKVLLYSTMVVNEELCILYSEKTICFSHVDRTEIMKGDSGAGIITGYGPGPMFPLTHDVKIIGVVRGYARRKVNNTLEKFVAAGRLSEYIQWIQGYVENVAIAEF